MIKGILLGIAAFLAVAIVKPSSTIGGADYTGFLTAALVGILVAVAVALPN